MISDIVPAPLIEKLRQLGANSYDLTLPEVGALDSIIHPDEDILGIVFGRYQKGLPPDRIVGRGVMVATDQRLLLIDHKPLFINCDEIIYEVVSGITHGHLGGAHSLTVHTRLGDIDLRTFNRDCADNFVEAIEAQIFNHKKATPSDY